jgi:hypothetical protein
MSFNVGSNSIANEKFRTLQNLSASLLSQCVRPQVLQIRKDIETSTALEQLIPIAAEFKKLNQTLEDGK